VTGCHKTAQWDTYAFKNTACSLEVSLLGGIPTLASAEFSVGFDSGHYVSAQHRFGPDPASNNVLESNQCVFLRGYKFRARKLLGTKLEELSLRAAAEPKDPPKDREDEAGSIVVAGLSSPVDYILEPLQDTRPVGDRIEAVSVPLLIQLHKVYHYLDHVLDYILSVCIFTSPTMLINANNQHIITAIFLNYYRIQLLSVPLHMMMTLSCSSRYLTQSGDVC
jgi:hypothetical protein